MNTYMYRVLKGIINRARMMLEDVEGVTVALKVLEGIGGVTMALMVLEGIGGVTMALVVLLEH